MDRDDVRGVAEDHHTDSSSAGNHTDHYLSGGGGGNSSDYTPHTNSNNKRRQTYVQVQMPVQSVPVLLQPLVPQQGMTIPQQGMNISQPQQQFIPQQTLIQQPQQQQQIFQYQHPSQTVTHQMNSTPIQNPQSLQTTQTTQTQPTYQQMQIPIQTIPMSQPQTYIPNNYTELQSFAEVNPNKVCLSLNLLCSFSCLSEKLTFFSFV